jgi:hypothetical protein
MGRQVQPEATSRAADGARFDSAVELKQKAKAKLEGAIRAEAESRVFRRQVVVLAVVGLAVLAFAGWRAGWGVVFGPGWWRW